MPLFISDLKELLERGDDLPTLPDVVLRLHRELENELSSDEQIAEIVERDPALTTRLLRVANSPLLRRGTDPIASARGAVQRLGVRQIRAVCIVLSVVKSFGSESGGLDHKSFWAHSAAVGIVSQLIHDALGRIRGVNAEDVYVSGLLHDVGLLLLEQFFQDRFTETSKLCAESSIARWQAEETTLGMDHGEIGALFLGRWSLPRVITDTVGAHHHPETAPDEYREVARVVHAAEVLCRLPDLGGEVDGHMAETPSDVLGELGVGPQQQEALMAELDSVIEHSQTLFQAA